MKNNTVCLLGGTGFVGYHLANHLTHHGYTVNILTRRRERHRDLLVNPAIRIIEANVYDTDQLRRNFGEAGAVINLIGILNERNAKEGSFARIHAELPGLIAATAAAAGVKRLLHMSALHADAAEAHSRYLKTKGEGEDRAHAAATPNLGVTSFRPSVIFGPGDSFFNRFAALLKLSPLFFPLACPDSRFAPVYVGDVAAAFCKALADDATRGQRLELCGPDSYTLKELVVYTRDTLGLKKPVIGLGDTLSRWQARLLGLMPGRPFTLDNYYSLQHDSLCTDNALPALGITPTAINTIAPGYIAGRNLRGRFHAFRQVARRQ
jgi:NADH dehydrogenase